MATVYAGMFGSGDWATPEERPKHYLEVAFARWPDSPGVFTSLLTRLKSKTVTDHQFTHFQDEEPPRAFTINGALGSTATTLVFDAPTTPTKSLKAGDILSNFTTNELIYVTVDPVSPYTQLTSVIRHLGGSGAGASIADNQVLYKIGSGNAAGSRAPKAIGQGYDRVYNYTQSFVNTCYVDWQSERTEHRPKDPVWSRAKMIALKHHKVDIALSFYHGMRLETTSSEGKRLTFTNGLDNIVTTNTWDGSAGVSLDDLEDACKAVFANGGDGVRVGLCGLNAFTTINRAVSRNVMHGWELQADAPKKLTYGLVIRSLRTPAGQIDLIHDPALTLYGCTDRCYVINPKAVFMAKFGDLGNTDFIDNAQLPDEQARKGYYITEVGLGVSFEDTHAIWKGLTTYVG